jgi:hypothetical protein
MKKIFALLAMALLSGTAWADGTLDGVAGAGYGAAVATDPIMPAAGEGGAGANGPMDLENLYVYYDATDVYICLTVNSDIGTNNWGKYKVFIQTDNGGAGGTSDPWGRAIATGGTFSPQFALSTWVDGGGGTNAHKWTGAWTDQSGTWAGGMAISATGNTGGHGGVEWKVPKAWLGNPAKVDVEATCTANGGTDNGQDTVPSDVNATDWGTVTTLDAPQVNIDVPVELSAFAAE